MEGSSISASAPMGTCVRSSTLAAHSGRIRSKAAAKIMRVELRKTLPAHPKNHSERRSRSTTWTNPFEKNIAASMPGYGNQYVGDVKDAQYSELRMP